MPQSFTVDGLPFTITAPKRLPIMGALFLFGIAVILFSIGMFWGVGIPLKGHTETKVPIGVLSVPLLGLAAYQFIVGSKSLTVDGNGLTVRTIISTDIYKWPDIASSEVVRVENGKISFARIELKVRLHTDSGHRVAQSSGATNSASAAEALKGVTIDLFGGIGVTREELVSLSRLLKDLRARHGSS